MDGWMERGSEGGERRREQGRERSAFSHESKGAGLVTDHSLALLGPRATLTHVTAVGICLQAEGTLQGTDRDQGTAQLFSCRENTDGNTSDISL